MERWRWSVHLEARQSFSIRVTMDEERIITLYILCAGALQLLKCSCKQNEVWVTSKSQTIISPVIWHNRGSALSHSVETVSSHALRVDHIRQRFSEMHAIQHSESMLVTEQVRNTLHSAKEMEWIIMRNCLGQCFSECTTWYTHTTEKPVIKQEIPGVQKHFWQAVCIHNE